MCETRGKKGHPPRKIIISSGGESKSPPQVLNEQKDWLVNTGGGRNKNIDDRVKHKPMGKER